MFSTSECISSLGAYLVIYISLRSNNTELAMAWIWVVLSAFIFLHLLKKLGTQKKNTPPGPRGLPIIGHLHLLGKNPHTTLRELATKHGPTLGLRFGSVPVVVVSSPATAELVLKTQDIVFSTRPNLVAFNYFSYGQKNLAFSQYGAYWRDMKKLCTLELLSNKKINQFLPMREAEIRLHVESIKQAAVRREGVDLSTKFLTLTRDMNFQMLYGSKFDNDSSLDEKGFKHYLVETSTLAGKFNLSDYFPWTRSLDFQGIGRETEEVMRVFDTFLEKIIDDHTQEKREQKQTMDFVDTMMEILESGEASFKYDRSHVKAVLLDLLIAGSDTSAITADWALAEMIKNPHMMKKFQKELEQVVGMDRMVEQAHLEKLEYLDLVMKETFRLHPVGPLLLPREAMQDCILDGYYIPKGTRTIVNAGAIMRDPKVWPDPETFNPERFAGNQIDVANHNHLFLPFGAGRRGCPGRLLGQNMVKLMVAQLVHCFDWELPNNMRPADMDMSEQFGSVVRRAEHLVAIPTYRLLK